MDSIGNTLRTEREKRGLSLEEAHENTKITVQNLSALEEDRFDSFPNKVYARAFLRDYANFLGLDSGELLTEYEETWSPKASQETKPASKVGSFQRVMGYVLLTLLIAAALGAGGYYGYERLKRERKAEVSARQTDTQSARSDGAVVPKTAPIAPPKPEAPKAGTETPKQTAESQKPEQTPTAAAPDHLSLEVATLAEVWVRVVVDKKTAFIGIVPKGQLQTFEGKIIEIRAGKAGAVQMKLNGQLQPPLEGGSLKIPGERTFTMPATPAPNNASPGVTAPSAPGH